MTHSVCPGSGQCSTPSGRAAGATPAHAIDRLTYTHDEEPMQTLISIKDGHKDDEGRWCPPFEPFEVTRRLAERIRSRDRRVFTLTEWEDYVALGKGIRRTALNAGAAAEVADDPERCAAYLLGLAGLGQPEPVVLEDAEPEHTDLHDFTNEELRERCREAGLPVYGNKDELVARLSGEEE